MEATRHLSKYVFPREYGLETVFTSYAKAHKYSDVADREEEIKVRVDYVLLHAPIQPWPKESSSIKDT
jgi:hypothetical protein